jgi:short-subunit dehydrogenase
MKKNIVVIGASRGIGSELVQLLSKNHNVLAMSRNLSKLEALKGSSSIQIARIDLSEKNVKNIISSIIRDSFEEVHVLINNAGYLVNKSILDISQEDIELSYATNVFGLIQSCQATVPFMKSGAHIVNIGSMGGIQGSSKFPGLSVYSSSKAAVAGFSECLAEELMDENIQVNCLALGAVQTEMLKEAFPEYKAPTSATEMAEFIADFSLNSNQWINGKVIPVSISTP